MTSRQIRPMRLEFTSRMNIPIAKIARKIIIQVGCGAETDCMRFSRRDGSIQFRGRVNQATPRPAACAATAGRQTDESWTVDETTAAQVRNVGDITPKSAPVNQATNTVANSDRS